MVCLSEEQLFHLVDSSIRERDPDEEGPNAAEVSARSHLEACSSCRAIESQLRSIVAGLSEEVPVSLASHKENVMRIVEKERITPRSLAGRGANWKRSFAPIGAAIALAAGTMLFVRSGRETNEVGEFLARGGAAESLAKDVGVTLHALGDPAPIREGAHLVKSAKLFASYRNVGKMAAFGMVVLQDARAELHWIYPAYVDPKSDPRSILLALAETETPLPDGSILDDVPPGDATIFTLVSAEPHTVSTLEKMAPLSLAKLGQLQPFVIAKAVHVHLP